MRQYVKHGLTKDRRAYEKWWRKQNSGKVKRKQRAYYRRHKKRINERNSISHLRRLYNLSPADWQRLFQKQLGFCAICRQPERRKGMKLAVDHNHDTGEVRGLLCHACNTALGLLQDSVIRAESLIRYLSSDELF